MNTLRQLLEEAQRLLEQARALLESESQQTTAPVGPAIFEHYKSYHPQARFGSKLKKLIDARLKEGFTPADLCEAIDGCHVSPFHCGENERGTKYQGLDLILRDASHVTQFQELARNPSRPRSKSASVVSRFLEEQAGGTARPTAPDAGAGAALRGLRAPDQPGALRGLPAGPDRRPDRNGGGERSEGAPPWRPDAGPNSPTQGPDPRDRPDWNQS